MYLISENFWRLNVCRLYCYYYYPFFIGFIGLRGSMTFFQRIRKHCSNTFLIVYLFTRTLTRTLTRFYYFNVNKNTWMEDRPLIGGLINAKGGREGGREGFDGFRVATFSSRYYIFLQQPRLFSTLYTFIYFFFTTHQINRRVNFFFNAWFSFFHPRAQRN